MISPPLQRTGRGGEGNLAAIAAELGDLPLALHLAGSFLKQFRDDITPAGYLAELRSRALLEHESLQGLDLTISPTNHALHIGRTFALSYDRLDPSKTIDGLALTLLARAACFAPGEPLPRDLLLATIDLPDEVGVRRRASRALYRLADLGLLDIEAGGALRLHRLLVAFVQDTANDTGALEAVEDVVYTTANQLNEAGYPAPLLDIQAHLRHITTVAMRREDQQAAHLCSAMDPYLSMIGDYNAARSFSERALAIRERVLGVEHPDTARSLNNLGALLRAQGDLGGARPYYERALAICAARLGVDHPTTQAIRANLAALDAPPRTAQQQIAEIAARFEAAVAQALADPGSDRAALQAQREARAQWAEEGEDEGSPYLALAAQLRALAARLAQG